MTITKEETNTETNTAKRPAPRFERPAYSVATPRQMLQDLDGRSAINGLIGLIFSATGPLAVILAAGTHGGLSSAELASWVFGVFFFNGILTVLASWLYRQPLAFFWTIPGTVVVGGSLGHLPFREVIGAYIVTAVLILVLGLTGWVRTVMTALPMPIVMAMVAGVFLQFGLNLVTSLGADPVIAIPMVGVFVLLSAFPAKLRGMPPILGTLIAGCAAVALVGRFAPAADTSLIAAPVIQSPQWSWPAIIELVVPLTITVLVVQNGQGTAVLRHAGHAPPTNMAAVLCGIWSLPAAAVGAVSTCLTGPTNALLTASGERERQYIAGIVCGLIAIVAGLFAPAFVRLMLAAPPAFITVLGGLAMLRALQGAFVTAFRTRFTMGALIAFVVSVSNVQFLNINAAFWGLLAGIAASLILERDDFAAD